MSEYTNQESEASRVRQERDGSSERAAGAQEPFAQGATSARRLATSRAITGRGNGPVRASSMLNMQKTSGNRAVQRMFDLGGLSQLVDFAQSPLDPNPYTRDSPSRYANPYGDPGGPFAPNPFPQYDLSSDSIAPNPYGPDIHNPFNPDDYASPLEEGEAFA